jgi:molecular chaperone GrpE (heat shock protein)
VGDQEPHGDQAVAGEETVPGTTGARALDPVPEPATVEASPSEVPPSSADPEVPVTSPTPVPEEHTNQPETPAADAAPTIEPDPTPAGQTYEARNIEPIEAADPVLEALDAIQSRIDDRAASDAAFQERIAAQDQLIGRMQQQIEQLRSDQVRSLLKPVLISLAKLHAETYRSQALDFDALPVSRIVEEFEFFGDRIVEAIDQLGFASVDAQPGAEFDRTIHTAAKALDTDDPSLDRRIARVTRQGFSAPEDPKPLLYAQVEVFRYLEPVPVEEEAAPAPGDAPTDIPSSPDEGTTTTDTVDTEGPNHD